MPGPTAYFNPADAGTLDPATSELVERRMRVLGPAYRLFYEEPVQFVRGSGTKLYSAHPRVAAAIAQQAARLVTHTRYLDRALVDYAEDLLGEFPEALGNVMFTCTGSEANDLALRIAKAASGGTGVIITENAYHGVTTEVAAISPSLGGLDSLAPWARVVPAPGDGDFAHDVSAAVADLIDSGIQPAALIVDTIFASDGVRPEVPGFADAVDTVRTAGGLFIADEVQPGFGRTGEHMWGYRRHGVQPDVVTLGKPMGNGYPMGAVITRPEILDSFCARTGYFNTFAATPVAAAAGQAVLDVIRQEDLMPNAARVGAYLKQQLLGLATHHPRISAVRGVGLYVGVELDPGEGEAAAAALTQALVNGMREQRVLIGAAGRCGNVLKVRPPLTFSSAHVAVLVAALDETLRQTP